MDLWNETERNLVELNTELSRTGDPARIRYMVIRLIRIGRTSGW